MPINIDGSKGIRQNTTETTQIPVGTTAQRPSNPAAGMMRFNTDEGYVEWYDEATDLWYPISQFVGVVATGGTVTEIAQDGIRYRVHTFTSDGTFEVTRGGEVEYLVVAGGGGGAMGAGGAGGLLSNVGAAGLAVSPQTYPVVVGGGGSGLPGSTTPSPQPGTWRDERGTEGDNSTVFGLTADGGGTGGAYGDGGVDVRTGTSGGSGGGGGGLFTDQTNTAGGNGTAGQGNDGGRSSTSVNGGSGGGGGAGAAGSNGTSSDGGAGGIGVLNGITGTSQYYAGGGGGGTIESDGAAGTGGLGGGGNGAVRLETDAGSGAPNTGGGGGGAGDNSGNGGSGIVIVRYRIG